MRIQVCTEVYCDRHELALTFVQGENGVSRAEEAPQIEPKNAEAQPDPDLSSAWKVS